jgi:hypothetical protein
MQRLGCGVGVLWWTLVLVGMALARQQGCCVRQQEVCAMAGPSRLGGSQQREAAIPVSRLATRIASQVFAGIARYL